jgi:glycosyltransferase involved in cell wall biosynthesis
MPFLDPTYSTTRMFTSQRPEGLKELPPSTGRVAGGGLRTRGCFKTSTSEKPLISIIVVVLNRANCFEKCIQSILGQSYDNVEFIVIDGGSTDGTLDILRKYSDKIDYWVSEPDHGLYYAMNKAVEIASGDWLNFIGSDDELLNCLATLVPQLKSNQSIYYGDVYGVGKKRIYNGPFKAHQFYARGLHQQGMFYPRSVFSTRRYDVTYRIAADWDLNIRCYIDGSYQFIYIQELVAIYNDIDGLSSKEIRNTMREWRSITRNRLGLKSMFFTARWSFMNLLEILKIRKPLKNFLSGWLESGRGQENLMVAKRLVEQGMPVEEAAEVVGLNVNEVSTVVSVENYYGVPK